jgi:flavin reductase (DIM6/NTAB) family NADH-FMN oxidoreductase RutF
MYFDADKNDHGLKFSPYKSCIIPRPIGWISTRGLDGRINLAPYSQFNTVGYDPGYVMFSAGVKTTDASRKDSVVNAEETGEFVYNMATYDLRHAVNDTSNIVDSAVDEMAAVGLTAAPCVHVKAPRVAECPVSMECEYVTTVHLRGKTAKSTHHLVIGRVLGVHIKDEFIKDGMLDVLRIRPLARLGYTDFTSVESKFTLDVPEAVQGQLLRGLMGGS